MARRYGRTPQKALLALATLLPALLGSCGALPPDHRVDVAEGTVRAGDPLRAREVAEHLDELAPLVRAALPDMRAPDLEVWIQPRPTLARRSSASDDADGFWASGPSRIHLRAGADSLRRTLAHELVHASLGASWGRLPGTLEEGLCDLVSARLVPEAADRMRAGRLSSAAFATGGLALFLEVAVAPDAHPLGVSTSYSARLRLASAEAVDLDPLLVLRTDAGLSTTDLPPGERKALYGLAYVWAERAAERVGVDGMHALCRAAGREGAGQVREELLLAAADLDADPASWNRACREALGPAELAALVRMHPGFVLDSLAEVCAVFRELGGDDAEALLDGVTATLSLPGTGARVALLDLPEVRHGLALALAGPAPEVALR